MKICFGCFDFLIVYFKGLHQRHVTLVLTLVFGSDHLKIIYKPE